jgi:glycosyltransferase involved in cell wall biosynthesis
VDRQAASGRSEKPAYSIVILNYNYGKFLHSCIRSGLSQTTLRQVEIIVVDDGSTDNSVAIMNEYAGRIIAAKKDNGGQASAINLGFSLSSGSRVLFLDADDELSPGCLQVVDDNWRPGLAAFSFNLDLINEAGSRTGRAYRRGHRASHGGWATAGGVDSMPMSGNVFSREFLLHTLPMPEREWRRSADVYLCNIAALTGETGSIDTCLGAYRVHGENGSKLVRDSRVNRTRLTFLINRDLRIEALHENIIHNKALEKMDNQRLTACLAHQQLRFIMTSPYMMRMRGIVIGARRHLKA